MGYKIEGTSIHKSITRITSELSRIYDNIRSDYKPLVWDIIKSLNNSLLLFQTLYNLDISEVNLKLDYLKQIKDSIELTKLNVTSISMMKNSLKPKFTNMIMGLIGDTLIGIDKFSTKLSQYIQPNE